jgi:hypothetical protein
MYLSLHWKGKILRLNKHPSSLLRSLKVGSELSPTAEVSIVILTRVSFLKRSRKSSNGKVSSASSSCALKQLNLDVKQTNRNCDVTYA